MAQNSAAKEAIARHAAGLLAHGETIFLDAGSTCIGLAREIPEDRNLTVITHSLDALNILRGKTGVRVVCPGGELDESLGAFVGPATEAGLQPFFVDRAFIGTAGLSLERGCINNTIAEARIKAALHEQARKAYVLADASKFGIAGFYGVLPPDRLRTVITDSGIAPETAGRFRAKGVEVLVAGPVPQDERRRRNAP
jgi:DeoR family fructose operon transcriptional repressor